MAIAGLHSIAAFDSSLHRDSQSQVSRHRPDEGGPRTRASSILQMWRDLEDENVVRHSEERLREGLRQQRIDGFNDDLSTTSLSETQGNEHMGGFEEVAESEYECEAWSGSQLGSQNENEDVGNSGSERSFNVTEAERERVRRIFRGWKNSSGRGHVSSSPQRENNSRPQWLGENECERVRIIREWVQMNSQQRESYTGSTEIQAAETGAQIDRVRDGLVINDNEGRTDPSPRRIRRFCGRQVLLDMVLKAERERQIELQGLLEYRTVSQFPHRNRIQSLLRGRFLRNEKLIEDQRPTSTAAGELGLLRQRHTVSGLREGFLSKLDNCVHGQVSCNHFDTSSNSDNNAYLNEAQGNSSQGIHDEPCEQFEPTNNESNLDRLSDHVDDLEVNTAEDRDADESSGHEEVFSNEGGDRQQIACVDFTEIGGSTRECVDGNLGESAAVESPPETSGNQEGEQCHLQETPEVFHQRLEPGSEESNFEGLSDSIEDPEANAVEDINWHESAAQVEWHEQATHDEERDLQQLATVEFSDWNNGAMEDMNENWQGSTVSGSSHDIAGEESRQLEHLPDMNELLLEDGSPGTAENWIDEPYIGEAIPATRVDTFYLPDDDNVYNVELRDLLSRRRVSSLLQSGFRESLDQLIQSYVERQSNATFDWDLDGMSPYPASVEQDPEEQSGDQNEVRLDAIQNPVVRNPPPAPAPPQPLWDQTLGRDNWSRHSMHQRMGIEWEIINDLRVDMTRLQHRMNSMERMLEACMDMQLELQRAIRQEVSAALNRSAGSPECSDDLSNDTSNWDYVRKGICCMCCDSNIDSLLYRCGHMCACSNCAKKLVQGKGKCPMCRAPVVEVIRAYSIV